MFLTIVLGLAIISVLWSLWSLREVLKHKDAALGSAQETLRKGRVIYQHDNTHHKDSSVSADSSSSLSD